MTVAVFGYLILISKDFYNLISIFSLVLDSNETIQ